MLVQPTFFPPIIQYVLMASGDGIVFEKHDNFQKQTYRNRCYIYGANGKQLLTVPVMHTKNSQRQRTRDVRIDNSFSWKKNMVKSLESSYRSSPYFEFYEDDVIEIFKKDHRFLLDLNFHAHELVSECLGLDLPVRFTESYIEEWPEGEDFRYLAKAKGEPAYALKKYTQVFENKHGFLANLSILDLLFNEGTSALQYLEEHRSLFFHV